MKKILVRILAVLVVLVVAAFLFRNFIARKAVEVGVKQVTGFPLEISSGYRCPELNRRVGGAKTSQHTLGLAADFTCAEFGSPVDIIKAIREAGINFDQCILEYGKWVHLSFSKAPRGKLLTIYDPKAGYLDGLRDKGGKQIA